MHPCAKSARSCSGQTATPTWACLGEYEEKLHLPGRMMINHWSESFFPTFLNKPLLFSWTLSSFAKPVLAKESQPGPGEMDLAWVFEPLLAGSKRNGYQNDSICMVIWIPGNQTQQIRKSPLPFYGWSWSWENQPVGNRPPPGSRSSVSAATKQPPHCLGAAQGITVVQRLGYMKLEMTCIIDRWILLIFINL